MKKYLLIACAIITVTLCKEAAAQITKLSAGSAHTLEIRAGTLWAWGFNGYGQLGINSTANHHSTPTQVGNDDNWVSVSGGSVHSIGLKNDGTIWGWGGQVANGHSTVETVPVQIGTDADWVAIQAGKDHNLAIKSNGTLWSWGVNLSGQLGTGNTTEQSTPVQIGNDTDWAFIGPGLYFSLAIKSNGTLWAWGENVSGQLGTGNKTEYHTPVQVGTANDWESVAGSYHHSLGLKTDGTLWAWGENTYGQLGLGNNTEQIAPIQVGLETNWAIIGAGRTHSIAIKTDGSLWAWGENLDGQLGIGTLANQDDPVQVGTEIDWIELEAGYNHTVAKKLNNSLWDWGLNSWGQLGINSNTNQSSPVEVHGVLPVKLISFSGENYGKSIRVQWVTSAEQNVLKFEIERSKDGRNFSKIGEEAASGNSSTEKNYLFIDALPFDDINFYRLKMIDKDDHYTYSKILSIRKSVGAKSLEIFPNPAKDVLQLHLNSFEQGSKKIQVLDANGRIVKDIELVMNSNNFSTAIDISVLPKGIYFIKVQGLKETMRFIKE